MVDASSGHPPARSHILPGGIRQPMALDVMLARAQFPALTSEWIYMDNAGGTQVPLQVADSVREYMLHSNVQLGASYEMSKKAGGGDLERPPSHGGHDRGRPRTRSSSAPTPASCFRMLALVLSAGWEPGRRGHRHPGRARGQRRLLGVPRAVRHRDQDLGDRSRAATSSSSTGSPICSPTGPG